jgi:hypothetical protein
MGGGFDLWTFYCDRNRLALIIELRPYIRAAIQTLVHKQGDTRKQLP